MWLDRDYQVKRLGVIGESGNEQGVLSDFSQFVDRHRPVLVTYNGRTFDMPVMVLRSLRFGVPMPWYYQDRSLRYRYSEHGHIDLCDWLAEHGAARSSSLDALSRLIGLPGKVGVDGSHIEGMFNAGLITRIQNYCLSDVVQTAMLFLRFRLLQGVIDRESYRRAVSAMTEVVRCDARLTDLAIDDERLLAAA